MAVSIRLPFDPYSGRGARWLDQFRAAMAAAADDPSCNCSAALDVRSMQLAGGGGPVLDSMATIYSYIPAVLGSSLAVVFAVVLITFRSVPGA